MKQTASFNSTSLYREETFIDRRTGTLRRLSPVLDDGKPDGSRRTLYVGQTQIETERGTLPLNFEIYADSLQEAIAEFNEKISATRQSAAQEINRLILAGDDHSEIGASINAEALPA